MSLRSDLMDELRRVSNPRPALTTEPDPEPRDCPSSLTSAATGSCESERRASGSRFAFLATCTASRARRKGRTLPPSHERSPATHVFRSTTARRGERSRERYRCATSPTTSA